MGRSGDPKTAMAQVLSPSVSTSDLVESGRFPLSLECGSLSHPTTGG